MKILFIRHGKAEYSKLKRTEYESLDYLKNFIGLSEKGISQAEEVSKDKRLRNSQIILSSPYTRAIQTAAIISKNCGLNIIVEEDLREWFTEVNMQTNKLKFNKLYKEFISNEGKHTKQCEFKWESLDNLFERTNLVLKKYLDYNKIIVVTHEMVIDQFKYKENIANCEIIEVDFSNNFVPTGFIKN